MTAGIRTMFHVKHDLPGAERWGLSAGHSAPAPLHGSTPRWRLRAEPRAAPNARRHDHGHQDDVSRETAPSRVRATVVYARQPKQEPFTRGGEAGASVRAKRRTFDPRFTARECLVPVGDTSGSPCTCMTTRVLAGSSREIIGVRRRVNSWRRRSASTPEARKVRVCGRTATRPRLDHVSRETVGIPMPFT